MPSSTSSSHASQFRGNPLHHSTSHATNIDSMPSLLFVCLAAIQFALVCCTTGTAKHSNGGKPFHFLGKNYSPTHWNEIKSFIHCMTNRGEWTKTSRLSGLLYKSPCNWARYVEGKCEITNLVENMVGLDYTWAHPNSMCTFPGRPDITIESFDRDNMCKMLTDRNMLVLGDSISEEFFYSLASAVIQANETCPKTKEFKSAYFGVGGLSPYQQITTSKFGCSNSVLSYLRHDYFLMSQEGDKYAHSTDPTNYGMGWPVIMHQLNTALLVVNRGTHFVDDDIAIPELNATLNAIREKHGNKISIIFRSTAPGHTDFNEKRYSPPLKNASEAVLKSFSWAKYENQNRLARALIHKYHENVLYLDVYPSMVLRADGHATEDGLHYCLPGPIDQWVVFLYNVLNLLEKV